MLFELSSLTPEQLAIARTPEIGAESSVRVSHRDFVRLFEVLNTALDVGSTAQAFDVPLVLSEPSNMHMRMDNAGRNNIGAADGIEVVLDVIDEDDVARTCHAILKRPSWTPSGLGVVPIGASVDFRSEEVEGFEVSGVTGEFVAANGTYFPVGNATYAMVADGYHYVIQHRLAFGDEWRFIVVAGSTGAPFHTVVGLTIGTISGVGSSGGVPDTGPGVGVFEGFNPPTVTSVGMVEGLLRKIKSIVGVAQINGGEDGFLNRLSIWQSFDESEFVGVGCARSKEGPFKLPSTIEIACGYDPSAFTKKGRSESQNLSLSFPWISQWDGLAQLNGHRSTVLLSTVKDDAVPWENTVYTGYRPNASPSRGDGDDEVLANSEGSYENFFIFGAR